MRVLESYIVGTAERVKIFKTLRSEAADGFLAKDGLGTAQGKPLARCSLPRSQCLFGACATAGFERRSHAGVGGQPETGAHQTTRPAYGGGCFRPTDLTDPPWTPTLVTLSVHHARTTASTV
jgi:hypothetical protein